MRLHSEGRGTHYTKLRGFGESLMRLFYRGDWPARVWQRFPQSCEIVCVHRELPLLAPHQPSIRVGFASDLHLGPTTPTRLAEAAFAALAQAKLDVLLLGGDYVFLDATPDRVSHLAELVATVPATTKLAVLGNHDLWTRHERIEAALERVGVQVLCNERVNLGGITVVGLDDPWTGRSDVARPLADLAADSCTIVLCHSPDHLYQAETHLRSSAEAAGSDTLRGSAPVTRDDSSEPRALYVCGHTHGGHVAAPWGPLIVPGRVGKTYPHGLHRRPSTYLYVSRGIGGVEVPFRTFAPPEVALFDLVARPSFAGC